MQLNFQQAVLARDKAVLVWAGLHISPSPAPLACAEPSANSLWFQGPGRCFVETCDEIWFSRQISDLSSISGSAQAFANRAG